MDKHDPWIPNYITIQSEKILNKIGQYCQYPVKLNVIMVWILVVNIKLYVRDSSMNVVKSHQAEEHLININKWILKGYDWY